jgi:hypothetical protein
VDIDRVVVVKALDDMEIDKNPMEDDHGLQDLMEIHNNPMEVD